MQIPEISAAGAIGPTLQTIQAVALVWLSLKVRRAERGLQAVLRLVLDQSPSLTPETRRFVAEALSLPVAPP